MATKSLGELYAWALAQIGEPQTALAGKAG
jgi:hypothetical protein